jgi:hypothetical protein
MSGHRQASTRFPRTAPASDGHTRALERLEEARGEQRKLSGRRDAADPGPAEARADTELRAAGEQVAAREAWAEWASREE